LKSSLEDKRFEISNRELVKDTGKIILLEEALAFLDNQGEN
jgi:hypothetical protein